MGLLDVNVYIIIAVTYQVGGGGGGLVSKVEGVSVMMTLLIAYYYICEGTFHKLVSFIQLTGM